MELSIYLSICSEAAKSAVAGRAPSREGPHQARAGETRAAAARTAEKAKDRAGGAAARAERIRTRGAVIMYS
jgi:hypothetical protein